MTAIPKPTDTIEGRIYAALEAKQEPPRPHLGASQIGHPCERWLWLSYRWAVIEKHKGRVLRLFRRGQDEEARIIEDLRAAGLEISETDDQGHQHRVSFGLHFGGSMDGIVKTGVPEAPNKPHVLEIKTHSKKSFDDLDKHGVQKSKQQHYAQMQVYMQGSGIDRALYVAICKDDDRIYTERVRYSKQDADALVQRAERIINAVEPPAKISEDPSWYQCRWCAAHGLCHAGEPLRQVNCRSCAHSTVTTDSDWKCERHQAEIPVDAQREGCRSHVPHPHLIPWPILDSQDEWTAIIDIPGLGETLVGEGGMDAKELLGC